MQLGKFSSAASHLNVSLCALWSSLLPLASKTGYTVITEAIAQKLFTISNELSNWVTKNRCWGCPPENPWLPSASSSSGPKGFQGAQNATPFQHLVWKGLLLFADGCKLFYWFRVAASHTTRNSPYPCGKHTAASSKVFWCRAASLGWPCNACQLAWKNSPQP